MKQCNCGGGISGTKCPNCSRMIPEKPIQKEFEPEEVKEEDQEEQEEEIIYEEYMEE